MRSDKYNQRESLVLEDYGRGHRLRGLLAEGKGKDTEGVLSVL